MCCLFGMIDYGGAFTGRQRTRALSILAAECESRGTDAAGVAYNSNGGLHIYKRPGPAHKLRLRIPNDALVIMGHTRMTTQGSERKNYNNHPFPGQAGGVRFALAHNGVLHNDQILRRSLPPTKIETDSYVAVQLLEKAGKLCPDSLCRMAEQLEGSFTLTVLDVENTLYLVRGNNPLSVRLFPSLGCYLYASTDEILNMALAALGIPKLAYTDIPTGQGDVMAINAQGRRTVTRFDDTKLRPQQYFSDWGWYEPAKEPDNYMETLMEYGKRHGVPERELRLLINAGYDALDLEEMIYDKQFRAYCLREILAEYGVR